MEPKHISERLLADAEFSKTTFDPSENCFPLHEKSLEELYSPVKNVIADKLLACWENGSPPLVNMLA